MINYFEMDFDLKQFEIDLEFLANDDEAEENNFKKRLSELRGLRDDITRKDETIELLQKKLKSLEREKHFSERKTLEIDLLSSRVHELEHSLANKVETCKTFDLTQEENIKLKQKICALDRELIETKGLVSKGIKEVNHKESLLQRQREEFEDVKRSFVEEIDGLKAMAMKLHESSSNEKVKMRDLEAAIRSRDVELEQLQAQLLEVKNLRIASSKLASENFDELTKWRSLYNELDLTKKLAASENSRRCEELESECQSLRDKFESCRATKAELSEILSIYENILQSACDDGAFVFVPRAGRPDAAEAALFRADLRAYAGGLRGCLDLRQRHAFQANSCDRLPEPLRGTLMLMSVLAECLADSAEEDRIAREELSHTVGAMDSASGVLRELEQRLKQTKVDLEIVDESIATINSVIDTYESEDRSLILEDSRQFGNKYEIAEENADLSGSAIGHNTLRRQAELLSLKGRVLKLGEQSLNHRERWAAVFEEHRLTKQHFEEQRAHWDKVVIDYESQIAEMKNSLRQQQEQHDAELQAEWSFYSERLAELARANAEAEAALSQSEAKTREKFASKYTDLEASYAKRLRDLDKEAMQGELARKQLIGRLADTGCALEVMLRDSLIQRNVVQELKIQKDFMKWQLRAYEKLHQRIDHLVRFCRFQSGNSTNENRQCWWWFFDAADLEDRGLIRENYDTNPPLFSCDELVRIRRQQFFRPTLRIVGIAVLVGLRFCRILRHLREFDASAFVASLHEGRPGLRGGRLVDQIKIPSTADMLQWAPNAAADRLVAQVKKTAPSSAGGDLTVGSQLSLLQTLCKGNAGMVRSKWSNVVNLDLPFSGLKLWNVKSPFCEISGRKLGDILFTVLLCMNRQLSNCLERIDEDGEMLLQLKSKCKSADAELLDARRSASEKRLSQNRTANSRFPELSPGVQDEELPNVSKEQQARGSSLTMKDLEVTGKSPLERNVELTVGLDRYIGRRLESMAKHTDNNSTLPIRNSLSNVNVDLNDSMATSSSAFQVDRLNDSGIVNLDGHILQLLYMQKSVD